MAETLPILVANVRVGIAPYLFATFIKIWTTLRISVFHYLNTCPLSIPFQGVRVSFSLCPFHCGLCVPWTSIVSVLSPHRRDAFRRGPHVPEDPSAGGRGPPPRRQSRRQCAQGPSPLPGEAAPGGRVCGTDGAGTPAKDPLPLTLSVGGGCILFLVVCGPQPVPVR